MAVEQRPYYTTILVSMMLYSLPCLGAQERMYSSIANLSTTWINHPSLLVETDSYILTPILKSGSDRAKFVCGFYCTRNGSESRDCVFGVLIYSHAYTQNFLEYLESPELVWSANRNNPVQTNATLELRQDGDLVLANSDGTLVWSSNTGGKSVSGLNLTEMGSLVLFGRNNEIIWQSIDHPTDSLLLGQKWAQGQQLKLISSISATNWSEDMYTLFVSSEGMSAYIESNPPQRYYINKFYTPYNYSVEYRNGSFGDLNIPPASEAQFMKFVLDGHLKLYQWAGIDWQIADVFTTDAGDCGYPMVCGKYGVCSNGDCGCPETTNGQANFFSLINFRQPKLGCSPVTPISCDHSQEHSLLELQNTYYFAFDSSLYEEKIKVEDCKNMCLRNCSCRAALFAIGSWDTASCLLLNEVFSIVNNDNYTAFYNTTLFVKVQNPYVKPSRRKRVILASSLGAFFGVAFLIGSCIVLFRNRLKESDEIEEDFLDQVPGLPTRYSYENLKAATEDFSQKLGEGGFGSVYEGELSDGTKIAVKCLDGLGKVKDSFLVEVKTIGSIHHVNLVKLIGFCFEKSHRLLVYEYMANGSLDRWIFGGMQDYSLPWQTRRKIILDVAKGLAYLHEDCSRKIIHLDIKPQNILLDQNFNAKVSDFGLSKLIEKDQSRVVTTMRGTPGYLAPEWLSSVITEKVDVYSFGIVMLEIVCGRKNLDWSKNEEDRHLLNVFKRKAEEEKLQDMVDRKNKDMLIHVEEAVEMMGIAAWCLQSDFTRRPSMSLVVKVLEGLVAAETNLDYDFTNSSVARIGGVGDQRKEAVDVASLLLPSHLSGPR